MDKKDKQIAVLLTALKSCRGILYEARTGDVGQADIDRILVATGEEALVELLGKKNYSSLVDLPDQLTKSELDLLLGVVKN